VSFEIVFVAAAEAKKLATPADLRRIFLANIEGDDGSCLSLASGTTVNYGRFREPPSEAPILDLSMHRPGPDWTWNAAFDLLREFDYFLVWPDGEPALIAHPDVHPSPEDWPGPTKLVTNASEIVEAIEAS
jgi:hypothetical protein